jgi:3-methyladenine DNA glycosylase AlkD
MKTTAAKTSRKSTSATKSSLGANSIRDQVQEVLAWLKSNSSKKVLDGMARYAIPSDKAFGVKVGVMQKQAKSLGRNHELALALWKTGWYEARMVATFLDDPERVTPAQMDRWCRDFDSWGICDTACFHLFDRTPYAFQKVEQWAGRREEFVKRAAFALLASLALHNKQAANDLFLRCLALCEKAASDERNFVKKGVSWALRLMGRRNLELNKAVLMVAGRLAASTQPAERWVGKDTLRDLNRPAVVRRLKK